MQATTDTVKALNSLLRGEIAAIETYRQALSKLITVAGKVQLEQCERSHEDRVNKLRQRIQQLGGTPAEGSGAWGAFAKLVEGGATALGEKSAISVLGEGEDHGLKEYQSELSKMDPEVRQWVTSELLPEAEQTHRTLSALKHALH